MNHSMFSKLRAVFAGLVVGVISTVGAVAIAQDELGLDPQTALAIKEAQLKAREAALDEREAKLQEAASSPCASESDPLAAVVYGPAIPADIPTEDVLGMPAEEAVPEVVPAPAEPVESAPPAANSDEVAKTLKAMKPKKAALVVVELDADLAATAMSKLSARNRAKILDHVPPPQAAAITAALGE